MGRGALLLHDVFLEEGFNVRLNPDYIADIHPDNTQRPFRNLFAALLIRSIKDVIKSRSKQHREDAEEWLGSDNNHITSFRHVCDILNLDVQKIREKIKTHIRNKNAGLPGTISLPYLRR